MIRAVIFDMFETLITHYRTPLYFSEAIAADAGIPVEAFRKLWWASEEERSTGKITLEQCLEQILRENRVYSPERLDRIVRKRVQTKEDCFLHLYPGLTDVLARMKASGLRLGVISNCLSEENAVIRRSILVPYFDVMCLSWEEGIAKPDPRIFRRCMDRLNAAPAECLYVGDGGSRELETARELGMQTAQAVWYFDRSPDGLFRRKEGFPQAESPKDLLTMLEKDGIVFSGGVC